MKMQKCVSHLRNWHHHPPVAQAKALRVILDFHSSLKPISHQQVLWTLFPEHFSNPTISCSFWFYTLVTMSLTLTMHQSPVKHTSAPAFLQSILHTVVNSLWENKSYDATFPLNLQKASHPHRIESWLLPGPRKPALLLLSIIFSLLLTLWHISLYLLLEHPKLLPPSGHLLLLFSGMLFPISTRLPFLIL